MRRLTNSTLLLAGLWLAGCAHSQQPPPTPPAQEAPPATPPGATPPVGVPPAATAPQAVGSPWASSHPDAARELCQWVGNHRPAAQHLFQWSANHPDRAQQLLTWPAQNPEGNVEAFVAAHRGWTGFDSFAQQHRPALNAFFQWARRHPEAAQEASAQPGGLASLAQSLSC